MLELTDILHIGFAFGLGFCVALVLLTTIGLGLAFFQRKVLDIYHKLGEGEVTRRIGD